jgi:hypothetical protein
MYVVAVGMILGAMNRLPIKLPRRGPGRRHSSGGSLQQTVTFDDVAGVDEAKEELSEIVVWSPHLQNILVAVRAPMHSRQHPWPQAIRVLFSCSSGSRFSGCLTHALLPAGAAEVPRAFHKAGGQGALWGAAGGATRYWQDALR